MLYIRNSSVVPDMLLLSHSSRRVDKKHAVNVEWSVPSTDNTNATFHHPLIMDVPVAANVLGTLGAVCVVCSHMSESTNKVRFAGPFRYIHQLLRPGTSTNSTV
jgi:hypothetical protein